MIPAVVQRLRATTQDAHAGLELELDIFRRLRTDTGRRRLVQGFAALHHAASGLLTPWLASLAGLDFPGRNRCALLTRDLASLGCARPPCRAPPPTVRSVAGALGLFYVLEGSTLGGHIIQKQLEKLGLDDRGLSFLSPYGAGTGARWRDFIEVLDRESRAPGAEDDIVEGAASGFAWVRAALRTEPVAA